MALTERQLQIARDIRSISGNLIQSQQKAQITIAMYFNEDFANGFTDEDLAEYPDLAKLEKQDLIDAMTGIIAFDTAQGDMTSGQASNLIKVI